MRTFFNTSEVNKAHFRTILCRKSSKESGFLQKKKKQKKLNRVILLATPLFFQSISQETDGRLQ